MTATLTGMPYAELITESDPRAMIEHTLPDPLDLFLDIPLDENGSKWDLDQSPWVRAVFDWWLDPMVDWIYLIWGSQTSKTTTMSGLALYAAKYDPGPAMWIAALEEEAEKFVVQRLKPFLEGADSDVRTGKKSDWRRNDLRLFGRMLLNVAWATSGAKLRSWPCRYLFGDEASAWPRLLAGFGDPLEYVKKRTRRYRGQRKGIFGTTPREEDHPSWQVATEANFAQWHVPCPECGDYQKLSFGNVKFGHCKHGEVWNRSEIENTTYYECQHCNARLTDRDKPGMVNKGRVRYVDPETGDPAELDIGHRSRTLQIPSTYSLFTSFGELAKMFVDAKHLGNDALMIFVTDELAEAWKGGADRPTESALTACIDEERKRGEVPEWSKALTGGVDIQKGAIFWSVRAWGTNERSALIDHGWLPRPEESKSLDFLDDIIARRYGEKPVDMWFLDSGYDADEVYAVCMRHPGRRVVPCKGASTDMPETVRISMLGKRNENLPDWFLLMMVNTQRLRRKIHDRITVPEDSPFAWRLHNEVDNDYVRHILSWERVTRKSGNSVKVIWVQRLADDHWLDSEIYSMAAIYHPTIAQTLELSHVARTARRRYVSSAPMRRRPIRREY